MQRGGAPDRERPLHPNSRDASYFMCLLTSFVISNIETCFLPPNTLRSLSSALMFRRTFASCRLFRLMYCQSFLVISVRGIGDEPTTAESASSGCKGAAEHQRRRQA